MCGIPLQFAKAARLQINEQGPVLKLLLFRQSKALTLFHEMLFAIETKGAEIVRRGAEKSKPKVEELLS